MTPCLKVKNEESCPFLSGLRGPHWLVFPLGSVAYQEASHVCSPQMILFYKKQYLKESFFSLEEKRHVSHHSSPSLSMPTSFQAIAPMCHTPKSFSTWIRSNIYEKQLEISEFQMCGTKKWLDFSSWVLGFSWSRVKMALGEKRGDHHVLRGEVPPCTNFGQIKQGSLQFGQYMMTWQSYPVSPVCLASPWGLGTGCD